MSEAAQQWDVARDHYEFVLGKYPQFIMGLKRLAALYADRLENDTKALELATKGRESAREDPDLAKLLGQVNYRRGDFRSATRFLTETLRTYSQDADVLFYLGLAQAQLREEANAEANLTRALELNPNHALAGKAKEVLGLRADPTERLPVHRGHVMHKE